MNAKRSITNNSSGPTARKGSADFSSIEADEDGDLKSQESSGELLDFQGMQKLEKMKSRLVPDGKLSIAFES